MSFFQRLLLVGTRPTNALEEALSAFLKGNASLDAFLSTLLRSRVFVLIKGSGETVPDRIEPLTLVGANGGPAVCVFTSPERSKPIQRRAGDYSAGLEIEFRAFLEAIPAGAGMMINPGTFFSTEATPEGVADLRSQEAASH